MSRWSTHVHHYTGEIAASIPYDARRFAKRGEERPTDRVHHLNWRISVDSTKQKEPRPLSRNIRLFLRSNSEILIQELSLSLHKLSQNREDASFGSFRQEVRNVLVGPNSTSESWTEVTSSLFAYTTPTSPPPIVFVISVDFRQAAAHDYDPRRCSCSAYYNPSLIPGRSLTADLERQLDEADTADVTFEIGDDVIPAHKWILQARVPYFQNMFSSGMLEATTNKIKIEDADFDSFRHVLKFIYCERIPELELLREIAPKILPIAEKYDLEGLKRSCAVSLANNLGKNNAVATLILAHVYRCTTLESECVRNLSHWGKSMDKGEFEPLKKYPDLLVEILTCKGKSSGELSDESDED